MTMGGTVLYNATHHTRLSVIAFSRAMGLLPDSESAPKLGRFRLDQIFTGVDWDGFLLSILTSITSPVDTIAVRLPCSS